MCIMKLFVDISHAQFLCVINILKKREFAQENFDIEIENYHSRRAIIIPRLYI